MRALERRLDRLEAVEIGGQRERLRLVAVAGAIGGEALLQAFAAPTSRLDAFAPTAIGMRAQDKR